MSVTKKIKTNPKLNPTIELGYNVIGDWGKEEFKPINANNTYFSKNKLELNFTMSG